MDKTYCLINYLTGEIYTKSPEYEPFECVKISSHFNAFLAATNDG